MFSQCERLLLKPKERIYPRSRNNLIVAILIIVGVNSVVLYLTVEDNWKRERTTQQRGQLLSVFDAGPHVEKAAGRRVLCVKRPRVERYKLDI